jgi:hypothetical protein
MSLATTMPMLGVGEHGRACFSPLLALIAPEREALDPTGEPRSPPFKAAVVNEEEPWCGAGTMAATMPTLGVGEQGRAGCVSPLLVLIAPEREVLDPTGEPRNPPLRQQWLTKRNHGAEQEPWRQCQ